jgi:hypothetical protein
VIALEAGRIAADSRSGSVDLALAAGRLLP